MVPPELLLRVPTKIIPLVAVVLGRLLTVPELLKIPLRLSILPELVMVPPELLLRVPGVVTILPPELLLRVPPELLSMVPELEMYPELLMVAELVMVS